MSFFFFFFFKNIDCARSRPTRTALPSPAPLGASVFFGQAIAATASIKSEMPTYFAVCSTSGSWSANPTSQRKLATAMIEYFTAGIAVSLRKNFSMTLHSAAPRPRGTQLLQCNIIYCNAKWQLELRH